MTDSGHSIKIQTNQLGKRFNREWIFRNLTAEYSSGETYAVTGPNGSGKSTLLQILWGQMPQSAGELRYFKHNQEIHIDDVFRHIAVATPYMDLIEELTLTEQIQFHFKLKPVRDNKTAEELIQIFYLEDAAYKAIGKFSSGMKQRLKLGLAMYTHADILFLDEPGSHLDKRAFDWYREQLSALPKSTLVFIGSNDPSEYPEGTVQIKLPDYKR